MKLLLSEKLNKEKSSKRSCSLSCQQNVAMRWATSVGHGTAISETPGFYLVTAKEVTSPKIYGFV